MPRQRATSVGRQRNGNGMSAEADIPEDAAGATPTGTSRLVLSAILVFVCGILACIGAIAHLQTATTAATVILGIFLVTEVVRVAKHHLITASILGGVGLVVAVYAGTFSKVVADASEGTLIFVTLFLGVAFLQYPSLNSPALRAAQAWILSQPPGRRYAALSVAAHFLGALINFAAMVLLITFLKGDLSKTERERMACAMIRGFALAASWSPFFASIAVILHVMPSVQWPKLAVIGVPLAMVMLTYSWLFDRVTSFWSRRANPRNVVRSYEPVQMDKAALMKICCLAVVLVTGILGISEPFQVSTPVAIFVVTPLVSIVWQYLLSTRDKIGSMRGMLQSLLVNTVSLRTEFLLFFTANFLGYSIASALNAEAIGSALLEIGVVGTAAIFCLVFGMLFATMLFMIHPLVLIVLLGQILPTQMLGIHELSLALCMALIWGTGTTSSPASGLTLFMTRSLNSSPWHAAWRLNAAYSFFGALVGATCISIANALLLNE